MKRVLGFFITLALSTVVFSVMAQTEQGVQAQTESNALRSVVEKNAYGDNWFISLGGDANLLGGEQDRYLSLSKRLGFGGAINVGKWFNPYFGAQIQVMGGALKGFNRVGVGSWMLEGVYGQGGFDYEGTGNPPSVYFVHNNNQHLGYPIGGRWDDTKTNYSYITSSNGQFLGIKQDFNYATATLDLMANFTNLFRGHYQSHNPIDVIGFGGLGVIHAFNNKVTTPSFWFGVAKVGVRVNFNITEKWAIYLEGQANATDKEFDGYVGNSSADGVVNLGLGIQYSFSKRYTTLTEIAQLTADEIDKLNRKINDNRYLIDNHQDILERQQNLLDKLQRCCDEKPKQQIVTQVVDNSGCLPQYVRFQLDSYKIETSEQPKIAEVVDFLKKNPSSKILIVGYADRKTGNPSYNLKLSKKRVDAVASELKRAGINENRILSDWKGDKEQPFPPNDWNRVVVMVERK